MNKGLKKKLITLTGIKTDVTQKTKLQIGILALLLWGVLGLTGNLGSNSFLLKFAAISQNTVSLTWTSPGDDNNEGDTKATAYDIRYNTAPITEANWGTSTIIPNPPAPSNQGTLQSISVANLNEGTKYYFAIKSVDDDGNWSSLSNIAFVTMPVTTPVVGGDAGDGGGGGGGGTPPNCTPSWQCAEWQACINGTATRVCSDLNNCHSTTNMPELEKLCLCQPDWTCGDWSSCDKDGQQTRVCADNKKCVGDIFQPIMIQPCGSTGNEVGGSDEPPIVPPVGNSPGNYFAGDLLRTPSSEAVYYIGSDYKKYVFPDAKTYYSWFANFDPVIWVTVEELDKYDIGGTMTYKPGTYMVKTVDTNKVYVVEGRGRLYKIPDEKTAASLYGANWAKQVRDVIPGYFASTYTQTGEVLSDYPKNTLLKYGSTYYLYLGANKVRKFSGDGLVINNFNPQLAVTIKSIAKYVVQLPEITQQEASFYFLR